MRKAKPKAQKPILMIHEVKEELFDLPLQDYTLTFDDGLYTQYLYFDRIRQIDTDKIFFISTNIVADRYEEQSEEEVTCREAHCLYFNTGCAKHYMNWSQIEEIYNTDRCLLGGHSHAHKHFTEAIPYGYIIKDTVKMMDVFTERNIVLDRFCFPYNYASGLYKAYLQAKGFKHFYGAERLDVNELFFDSQLKENNINLNIKSWD